jgi:glycosyltransferase involved in cell wall biosynthesis
LTTKGRDLCVLVPVLRRPHRIRPVLDSVAAATPGAEVLFVADADDASELEALEREGADFITVDGGYGAKINEAVRRTTPPLIFTAADDLHWHPGWFETAKGYLSDEIRVVGVNDLCSERVTSGVHATHFLMTRDYALRNLLDGSRGPWPECYGHWYGDDEVVGTAIKRGAIAFATDAIVEHRHYMNKKAALDYTYRKGQRTIRADKRLYLRRRRLWR